MKKARFSHFIMNVPEHLNNEWLACFPKECFSVKKPPYSYKIKESQLEAKIYYYLSQNVPKLVKEINTANNVSKFVIDEDKFKCWIAEPFEHFICGKDGAKGFEELKKINKPPHFCGSIFKVGDPTYTCKDCAADPTCVFCHDCFHQSIHTKHKYKLFASQGRGGYCDCGDKEAWTNDPACNKHKECTDDNAKDPLDDLPDDVYNYATFLFTVLLKYCADMVYWRMNNSLPSPLTIESNDDNSHIVMLFNDEIHSYNEVINALKNSIKATDQQGFHLAAVVDKEGRSAIFNGNMTESVNVAVTCKIHTSKNGKIPLRCEAIHKDVVAHQLCAIEIMSWLTSVVDKSDALRRLLCLLVCKPLCDRSVPLLDQVINDDAELWKAARLQVHHLFVNSLLMDISYGRVEFAVAFAKNYVKMINDFIEDDHDHSLSIASLSVQIFTVPSIAQLLILEHNILEVCLETFLFAIGPAVGGHGSLDFQGNLKLVNLKRSEYILNDIRYLLRLKPEWKPHLREKFIAFFHHFLQLLKIMQGMDSVTHKVLSHVAYEPNWESGFNLQLWCMSLFHEMYSWCYSDKEVLCICVDMCVKKLNELPLQFIENKFGVFADYNIKTMRVSIHAPLSRFIAGLLCGLVKQNLNVEEHVFLNLNNTVDETVKWQQKLIEYPLRSLVLMAQVNTGMWKRNGFSILNTVLYYQNIRFTCEMYDRDIQLLQMAASCMDSDYFIDSLLYKYDLAVWVSEENKENLHTSTVIAEEFFLTLFYIISERYVIGIGETTYKEILTREVIHRLAIGPSSRSNLVKRLPAADPEDDDNCTFESLLDEVLNEVADYREPGLTGKGLFCLKTHQMCLCNQFFIHYTKIDRSKVLEERNLFLKRSNDSNAAFLATPPKFLPQLQSILKLLHSGKLAFLLKLVFNRALSMTMVTVEIIEVSLLIIAIGLMETKRARISGKFDFNFLGVLVEKNNNEFSISELIENLHNKSSSKEFQGMIKWIKLLIEEEMTSSTIHSLDLKILLSKEDSSVQDDKAKKLLLSKQRKEKLIAQMNTMQTAFMKHNPEMFQNDFDSRDGHEDINSVEDILLPIAIGYKKSYSEDNIQQAQCIFCQEEQLLDNENSFIVMIFVNESSVFHFQNKKSENLQPSFCDSSACVNVSSCGHIAHGKCWDKYYLSKFSTSASTFFANRLNTIDVSKSEFLCPLCNSLCNSVLPLLPRIVESLPVSEDHVSLTELLAYMDKFSSELSRNQKNKETRATGLLQTCGWLPPNIPKIICTYIGLHEKTPNFMELFLKKLLKLSSASPSAIDDIAISSAVPLSWMACSFTLQALECQFRTAGKNMFFNVSERQSQFLNSFVNLLQSSCVIPSYTNIEEFAENIFNFFCGNTENDISILTLDVFGVMISLRFIVTAVQHLFQSSAWFPFASHLLDDVAFKLCLNTYIIKCFIAAPLYFKKGLNQDELTTDTDILMLTENENEVARTFATLKSFCGIQVETQEINGHLLKKHVIDSLLPFLRCSAYFFHFLTGVKIPESLKIECVCDELYVLLTYLNVSVNVDELLTLNWLMQEERTMQVAKRWCEHKDVYNVSSNLTEKCYFTARRLISLPREYSSLINMASGFRCPTTGDSSCNPSMCLVCGEMLCSQCYCCQTKNENQYGACVLHSMSCSNSVGIFCIVRQSEIVLLYNQTLGMMIPSPYLDQYGEADRGFRRGNPLFLNEKRYESLERLWISQQVPETIVRKIETDRSLLSSEWSRY